MASIQVFSMENAIWYGQVCRCISTRVQKKIDATIRVEVVNGDQNDEITKFYCLRQGTSESVPS